MKRLSNEELMDYLDGALSESQRAGVEAHLATCADDAQLLADLRMAQSALREWDAHEAVLEASQPSRGDFWVKVREQLPLEEKRVASPGLLSKMAAWFFPTQSPMQMSLRGGAIAVAVAIIAMLATWFGPQQTQYRVTAQKPTPARQLSPQERAEIQSRQAPRRDGAVSRGAVDSADSADRE
jgi:anti-sigma factor RsiW